MSLLLLLLLAPLALAPVPCHAARVAVADAGPAGSIVPSKPDGWTFNIPDSWASDLVTVSSDSGFAAWESIDPPNAYVPVYKSLSSEIGLATLWSVSVRVKHKDNGPLCGPGHCEPADLHVPSSFCSLRTPHAGFAVYISHAYPSTTTLFVHAMQPQLQTEISQAFTFSGRGNLWNEITMQRHATIGTKAHLYVNAAFVATFDGDTALSHTQGLMTFGADHVMVKYAPYSSINIEKGSGTTRFNYVGLCTDEPDCWDNLGSCTALVVANSNAAAPGVCGGTTEGSTCPTSIACDSGFTDTSGSTGLAACGASNTWQNAPTCTATCGSLSVADSNAAGAGVCAGVVAGNACGTSVVCNVGFERVGGAATVTCSSSGTWLGAPSCASLVPIAAADTAADSFSPTVFLESSLATIDFGGGAVLTRSGTSLNAFPGLVVAGINVVAELERLLGSPVTLVDPAPAHAHAKLLSTQVALAFESGSTAAGSVLFKSAESVLSVSHSVAVGGWDLRLLLERAGALATEPHPADLVASGFSVGIQAMANSSGVLFGAQGDLDAPRLGFHDVTNGPATGQAVFALRGELLVGGVDVVAAVLDLLRGSVQV